MYTIEMKSKYDCEKCGADLTRPKSIKGTEDHSGNSIEVCRKCYARIPE